MTRARFAVRMAHRLFVMAGTSALLLLALACNDEEPPAQPARFNRPNRVDFACFDGATFQVVPRTQCAGAQSGNKLALNAIVTQSGRGEVAVVNLRDRKVLDSRREVPGYTFVPVGESPQAIVIPPDHPQHTYVADFGSRDVRVLRTRALVSTVDEAPTAQIVSLANPKPDGGLLAPIDMVLAPDESALFVAVPDHGLVLRLPIQRCAADSGSDCQDGLIDESAIGWIDVNEPSAPAPGTAVTASRYQELCDFARASLPDARPLALDAAAFAAEARPTALALDAFCRDGEACTERLLVADAVEPVIHALDVGASWGAGDDTPRLPPLVTGVPTSDVVVTPRVPRTADGDGETQYVYAIDAQDGSVLVLEDGQVLNVNGAPGRRANRLNLSAGAAGATTLEVMTPAFDVRGPAAQWVNGSTDAPLTIEDTDPVREREREDLVCTDQDHDEEDPARLRGVFLAVAMTDGSVHVVDVHDMELRANDGADVACRHCAFENPAAKPEELQPRKIPLLVRNQERLAVSFVVPADEAQPSFAPVVNAFAFYVDNSAYTVRADGTTASPRAPGLDCIRCDPALTLAFPTEDSTSSGDQPAATMDAAVPDAGAHRDGGEARDGGEPAGDAGTAPEGAAPSDRNCTADTSALLCVANDPWSSGADTWYASYEGALPASDGHGRFVEPDPEGEPGSEPGVDANGNRTGGLELVASTDFCRAGVLGEEDIAADYGDCAQPGVDLAGDQLVLTSRPLGRAGLAQLERGEGDVTDACAELRAELDDDEQLQVAFEIRRAYSDRVVIDPRLLRPIGKAKTFADISACYQDAIDFNVRSSQAFTVIGVQSGFQHHIRANAAGRCQVDPDGDPLLRGRARLGCEFRNHSLQFRLHQPGASDPGAADRVGVGLQVVFGSPADKLVFHAADLGFGSATVVPVQLRYSEVDRKLYLVDVNDRGLVPISVDPFPVALTATGQFN